VELEIFTVDKQTLYEFSQNSSIIFSLICLKFWPLRITSTVQLIINPLTNIVFFFRNPDEKHCSAYYKWNEWARTSPIHTNPAWPLNTRCIIANAVGPMPPVLYTYMLTVAMFIHSWVIYLLSKRLNFYWPQAHNMQAIWRPQRQIWRKRDGFQKAYETLRLTAFPINHRLRHNKYKQTEIEFVYLCLSLVYLLAFPGPREQRHCEQTARHYTQQITWGTQNGSHRLLKNSVHDTFEAHDDGLGDWLTGQLALEAQEWQTSRLTDWLNN
jgi:hypothetical protein